MEIENNFYNEFNNTSLEDFDNLTPLEMHNLLYEEKSIVRINEKNEDLTDIIFFNQIIGKNDWDANWKNHKHIINELIEVQKHSEIIKKKLKNKIVNNREFYKE